MFLFHNCTYLEKLSLYEYLSYFTDFGGVKGGENKRGGVAHVYKKNTHQQH